MYSAPVSPAPSSSTTTSSTQELIELKAKLDAASLPQDLRQKVEEMLRRIKRMVDSGSYSKEYDSLAHYAEWIVALPWGKFTEDKIDLASAKQILDSTHYGMQEPKDRILEYLSILKLKENSDTSLNQEKLRAPAIFLVGLVGTGKTTFAYALARAMGRTFARIPFGGLGSARDLRGRSRLFPESEPGAIVKALRNAGSSNPVLLLDEIDRVADDQRADIMGVLVELLDPTQNNRFLDHYLDYPLDLSQVLFVATANNTTSVATAVLDRLEVITMPSYTDDEKIHIAKEFLFPRILHLSGLNSSQLQIDPAVWPQIVRPLGYDAGIRTLERTIEGIARKAARQIVEGSTNAVAVNTENVKEYVKSY